MEAYILDASNRSIQTIDSFNSFIWAERSRKFGDFKLTVNSTPANRKAFPVGTRLAMNKSLRVMVVETLEDNDSEDGKSLLTITGRSLEKIMIDRIAHGVLDDTTTTPKWSITDDPKSIAEYMYHYICVLGSLDAGDIISDVAEGSSLFPPDTIDPPVDEVTVEFEPITLYDAETQLCDIYGLGFRIVRDPVTAELYFDVYTGCDRTTAQTDLPAVVFSPDLENLTNVTQFDTIASYKNVAYVFSPVGYEIVYADGIDPSVEGFERRVLLVNATDITDTDPPTASAKMIQRGLDELAKNRPFKGFDGEISQESRYIYGVDYNLNDLVEVRAKDGVTNRMQVTEQIFVSDEQGERSYPTLSLNTYVTPGSWLATPPDEDWADVDDSVHWADLP